MRLALLVLPASALAAAGCVETSTPGVCRDVLSDLMSPGVFVHITDSTSGAIATANAKAVARAGAYADSATGTGQAQPGVRVAFRVGTYEVTVTKAGYQTWYQNNVVVAENQCGVPVGESLHARLQPE